MSQEAMLDYKICDIIVNIMKERIKVMRVNLLLSLLCVPVVDTLLLLFSQDKIPVIRIQTIMAVFRLQEKENKSCPVTKSESQIAYNLNKTDLSFWIIVESYPNKTREDRRVLCISLDYFWAV